MIRCEWRVLEGGNGYGICACSQPTVGFMSVKRPCGLAFLAAASSSQAAGEKFPNANQDEEARLPDRKIIFNPVLLIGFEKTRRARYKGGPLRHGTAGGSCFV